MEGGNPSKFFGGRNITNRTAYSEAGICRLIIGCLSWRRPEKTPTALSFGVYGVVTIARPNGMTALLGGKKPRSLWRRYLYHVLVLLIH